MREGVVTEVQASLPRIDVLMPTHNHLELTIQAVNALYRNTTAPFHLTIMDDSTDLTPAWVQQLQGGLKKRGQNNLTFLHSKHPYKSGNQFFNQGFKHTTSKYVALVMNSVRVEPEWEIHALPFMEGEPKAGVVGMKCLQQDGTIESAGLVLVNGHPRDRGRGLPGHRLAIVQECLAVQWAFALVRREAVPTLDENTYHGFVGWDDIDNCFVMRQGGWKVFYSGYGAGYHAAGSTRGTSSAEGVRKNAENAEIFYKRWGYWPDWLKAHPGLQELRPDIPIAEERSVEKEFLSDE